MGILSVRVSDFENILNGVADVSLAVWTEEDQSDLQWIQMGIQEDSSYYIDIAVSGFGYKMGEYQIHAYVVDGAGEQYMVGAALGVVE